MEYTIYSKMKGKSKKERDGIEDTEIEDAEVMKGNRGGYAQVRKTPLDTIKICIVVLLIGGALIYFFL